MKLTAISCCIILLMCSSCATLDVNEIKNLDKIQFEPLVLIPDTETNDLRLDIIRETEDPSIFDSTGDTELASYHPIGFYLGNGLYYDLNRNISLKLDYLLDFSPDNDFEIKALFSPGQNRAIIDYRYKNDTFSISYPPRDKIHYSHHQVKYGDSIAYMNKKWLKYAIIETDTTLVYSGKRRSWDVIRKLDDDNYYLDKKFYKVDFQNKGNQVFLGKSYSMRLTNNNSTIEIIGNFTKKSKVMYTIERSKDAIYIYNKKYSGKKIKLGKNSIEVYPNQKLGAKYELVARPPL